MPLYSMTAYGAGEHQGENTAYQCEVKTLNSRYLEVNVRLPRFLMALEAEIISVTKKRLARGKVDISVNLQIEKSVDTLPQLNPAAVGHYLEVLAQIESQIQSSALASEQTGYSPRPGELARFEGVLEQKSRPVGAADEHRDGVSSALSEALAALVSGRASEGNALESALIELVSELGQLRTQMAEQAEELNKVVYENYLKRIQQQLAKFEDSGLKVAGAIPEERILAEVSVLTDKADIAEELTRLAAHEEEFRKTLALEEPVGRKLDFICQEMHREVNTMSNKLTQTSAAKTSLSMKQVVERLRQQVQNVE